MQMHHYQKVKIIFFCNTEKSHKYHNNVVKIITVITLQPQVKLFFFACNEFFNYPQDRIAVTISCFPFACSEAENERAAFSL